MSSQGAELKSDDRPGSCGLGSCLCRGRLSDAANLPVRGRGVVRMLSRRKLFGATLGGVTATMLAGVGMELAVPRQASAQSTHSVRTTPSNR